MASSSRHLDEREGRSFGADPIAVDVLCERVQVDVTVLRFGEAADGASVVGMDVGVPKHPELVVEASSDSRDVVERHSPPIGGNFQIA